MCPINNSLYKQDCFFIEFYIRSSRVYEPQILAKTYLIIFVG